MSTKKQIQTRNFYSNYKELSEDEISILQKLSVEIEKYMPIAVDLIEKDELWNVQSKKHHIAVNNYGKYLYLQVYPCYFYWRPKSLMTINIETLKHSKNSPVQGELSDSLKEAIIDVIPFAEKLVYFHEEIGDVKQL